MANGVGSQPLVYLPLEVKLGIMSQLPSMLDMFRLGRCCKQLYHDVREAGNFAAYDILRLELGAPTLAIAVARYAASTAPWKCSRDPDAPILTGEPEYLQHVEDFCAKYLSKSGTELRLPKHEFTFDMAVGICKFHKIVHQYVDWHAAGMNWGFREDSDTACFGRTARETARLEKTFYIVEIISHLFVWSPVTQRQERNWRPSGPVDRAFTRFWLRFAPWEAHNMLAVELDLACFAGHSYRRIPDIDNAITYESRCNWIRMVMWMGVEKTIKMILFSKFTEQQNEELRLIVSDPRFQRVRCQIFLDPGCWFTRDFSSDLRHCHDAPVFVDLGVLKRYDKHSDPDDKRGDIWLAYIKDVTWHHPQRSDYYASRNMQNRSGKLWSVLWWDRARLRGGRIPPPVERSWERIRERPVGFFSHYSHGWCYEYDGYGYGYGYDDDSSVNE